MSYTTKELLEKFGISRSKLDRLVRTADIETWNESVKNGTYHYEIKHYNKEQIDRLTSEDVSEILSHRKKRTPKEFSSLDKKYINKAYRHNSKMIDECEYNGCVLNKSRLCKEINEKLNSTISPRIIEKYECEKIIEENQIYKVTAIGIYEFNAWKDALFLNPESEYFEHYRDPERNYVSIRPCICDDIYCLYPSFEYFRYSSQFLFCNVVVEVVKVETVSGRYSELIGFIKSFEGAEDNKICSRCNKVVEVPGETFVYKGKEMCRHCVNIEKANDLKRSLLKNKNAFIVDLETTGIYSDDEIVNLAVINMNGDIIIDELIKPSVPISNGAYYCHGISEDMVKNSLTMNDISEVLKARLLNKILIFYGEFHKDMFRSTIEKYNIKIKCKYVILEKIQSQVECIEYEPNHLRLDGCCHNALKDCFAMLELLNQC